jgi:hypothetical protein
MAIVLSSWMLAWQASIAQSKLDALAKEKGAEPTDWAKWAEFIKDSPDAAFYSGKVAAAKYYINNVLPEVYGIAKAIKTEDLSIMEIATESFAT